MSTLRYLHATESTITPAHQQNANRNRILVIEDNQLSSKLLKQLLTAHGYEVLESSQGLQALNLARDAQPDLILMDIRLPDISGLELTRLLKQDDQTKNIPIIAITAFASPEDENKDLEGGCDAYAPKPINLGNLLRTIESFLKIRPATLATLASITPPGWV
jgi:two-component system cell cycle response regulator DivK